jgi:hypothetical protein
VNPRFSWARGAACGYHHRRRRSWSTPSPPPVNQPEGRERDVAALRPPCSQPSFCASTPKIHKLPEYNPSPKGHSGWSGGGLVPPWTCPIPIALPKRAIFDHRSLYKSAPRPLPTPLSRGEGIPFSRYGGADKMRLWVRVDCAKVDQLRSTLNLIHVRERVVRFRISISSN